MDRTGIAEITAREILDSRGNPTVETKVTLKDGSVGRASVPSGASTGIHEALEMRDEDKKRYNGKGVLKAVDNVNHQISEMLHGKDATEQHNIDRIMLDNDGTEEKTVLGANSILSVSLAVAKAAAESLNMPLYRYIGGVQARRLPRPMMNVLNGGKHADSSLNLQEFMIVPISAPTYTVALEQGVRCFFELKKLLKWKNLTTSVGDEGGYAPKLENDEQAIELIIEAVSNAGLRPGEDICIAIDAAASEFRKAAFEQNKEGYLFWKSGKSKSTDEMISYWKTLCLKYPIISIEDGLDEEDWAGWSDLNSELGNKVQLVGDDLFVTRKKLIQYGIQQKAANSVLIKPNQVGTLTETLESIETATRFGWSTIVSHRSGETTDTTIADIAVAMNTGQIKTGAPSRGERTVKYNRLLEIENELGKNAIYSLL